MKYHFIIYSTWKTSFVGKHRLVLLEINHNEMNSLPFQRDRKNVFVRGRIELAVKARWKFKFPTQPNHNLVHF